MIPVASLSPNQIWEKKRHLSRAEFVGKCVAVPLMIPLTLLTCGLAMDLIRFNGTSYWKRSTARELRVKILSSTLAVVSNDTRYTDSKYTIDELRRFGFIEEFHADKIKQLVADYNNHDDIRNHFRNEINNCEYTPVDSAVLIEYQEKHNRAQTAINRIEQSWIQFRDSKLAARLPNPTLP